MAWTCPSYCSLAQRPSPNFPIRRLLPFVSCPYLSLSTPVQAAREPLAHLQLPAPPDCKRLTRGYLSTSHLFRVRPIEYHRTIFPLTKLLLGSQFCINYSVVRTPEPACYVFFKLFINGRNITNWGINPAQQASGSVTRALYEPGERWQYEEDGIIYRKAGIESRTFHFAPEKATSSVADDGGLIEVQVFRAKGRRRRSPRLDQYRNQDRYGFT